MMKMRCCLIIIVIILAGGCLAGYIAYRGHNDETGKIVAVCDASEYGFNSKNPAYEMGYNKDGKPIFKDKDEALDEMMKANKNGFDAIQREYHLLPISFWKSYRDYAGQINLPSSESKSYSECLNIAGFFDIYENSYASEQ